MPARGRSVSPTRASERLTGLDAQDWQAGPFLGWIDPSLNEATLPALGQALSSFVPQRVTLEGHRDGRVYFCENWTSPVQDPVSGEWNYWVAVHMDITARMEYERSSEEQLHQVRGDAGHEPGRLCAAGCAGPGLCGQSRLAELAGASQEAEVLGREESVLLEALLSRSEDAARPAIASAWRGEVNPGSQSAGACPVVLLSPRRRTLSMIVRAVEDTAMRRLVYFRDVSAEAEMAQMKSDFLSTAAHELRSPMASIRGFAELLTHRASSTLSAAPRSYGIHPPPDGRLSHLINELLDLKPASRSRQEQRLPLSGAGSEPAAGRHGARPGSPR